ncbi:MAG: L-histidine N(alpha)-methyltransferase [Chloroflexaceae bacterium]|nr:L-histidine N(alpha)-methyltransferase [Chloroflexaceae bacterium]
MANSSQMTGKEAFLPPALEKRLQIENLLLDEDNTDRGEEVMAGLTRAEKTLPPRYFYDDRGSELFEQICELPEYYPTRTEATILRQSAGAIAELTGPCELVELGSGSSTKTRLLLDAYQTLGYPLRYVPVDVSAGMLRASAQTLLQEYDSLKISALAGTYELALARLLPSVLPARLLVFLGSTLGNFSPQECDRFFEQVMEALQPGDYFLLGIDLQKPKGILEAAYNDSQGVTAAFNLNMLQHLNWRFGGNFAVSQFEHRAIYNESEAQIEMHLLSKVPQTVTLQRLNFLMNLAEGEYILTEISRKFDCQAMQSYLSAWGLNTLATWRDSQQWFGLLLGQAG